MPRPKKPFNQQKRAGCRRCGHRQNHPRDNCPAKGMKCFKCSNMGHFASPLDPLPQMKSKTNDFLEQLTINLTKPGQRNSVLTTKNLTLKQTPGADVTVISDNDFKGLKEQTLIKSDK